LFEEALARVEKNLRTQALPTLQLVSLGQRTCALKLHVGHYKDTHITLEEIKKYINENGYQTIGNHREVYLTPSMGCYPPETWKTVLLVELEKK
jgi:hypothetical protein